MHLAINYSPTAAQLVSAGKIKIDYFKTPDWDWLISEAGQCRPVAVHFTLTAGNGNVDQVDWRKVEHLAHATGTPYINLHLDARQDYYPELAIDTTNMSEVDAVTAIILADVRQVVEHFGPDKVILENSPYHGEQGGTLRLCVQPDLIARVIQQAGCGLLLDLSHAIIAARTLGMDPENYICQLPVKRLKEMHFAGVHRNSITGGWMDHLSILEQDWYWLDWALEHIESGDWSTPWMLAFEYGGIGEPFKWRTNPEVISKQVPELYEHIKMYKV